jgi:hypothetical protein
MGIWTMVDDAAEVELPGYKYLVASMLMLVAPK